MQIAFVLGLLALAVVLFARGKTSVDVVTLLLLVALVGGGILTTTEAFAGFSSDIIIILGSLFVISGALQETGLLDALAERLLKLRRVGPKGLLLLLMGSAAGVSAFMNNTTVAAMLVPPVIAMAKNAKISPSRLLMPLAFSAIMGGTCTLIGTSTNVAVSGYIAKSQLPPLGFFELAPIGLVIVIAGFAYMLLIGQRFLPDHKDEDPMVAYALRDYLSEIVVLPGSPLIGQTIAACELSRLDFRILGVIRREEHHDPETGLMIAEADTLLVEGRVEMLMSIEKSEGVEIRGKLELDRLRLGKAPLGIVEVLIAPDSNLVGRTLKESKFSERFGLQVLAIHRHGQPLREKVGDVPLLLGDLLLVEGPVGRVELLRDIGGLIVLDEHFRPGRGIRRGLFVSAAFAGAIASGSLGWLPLPIAFLAAALLAIMVRGISIDRARRIIDLRLLLLIGGMTAFGTAMEKTGAAALLAHWLVSALSPFGVMTVMGGFLILTIVLTQPMSNAAAALVVLPVAMSAAQAMGASGRTFAIAVMLAASISFVTPLEPACLLVYGPGRYRFIDFVRVGGGLTLILLPIIWLLIPVFWPLYP